MATVPTLVNGKAYSYVDISVEIAGVRIVEVNSINYTVTQEKENHTGLSAKPVSRGRSFKEYSANMEMSLIEVEKLRNRTLTGDLTDLPMFNILVIFDNGVRRTKHILRGCEFKDDGVETTRGDTNIVRTYDLIIADIDFNPVF